jgi:hypothetical protein
LNPPHPLILPLDPMPFDNVLTRHSVQGCAPPLASTRQAKMTGANLFPFIDRQPIVLFIRQDDFGSINPNLAFALTVSAIMRSQQRMFPAGHGVHFTGSGSDSTAYCPDQYQMPTPGEMRSIASGFGHSPNPRAMSDIEPTPTFQMITFGMIGTHRNGRV